MTINTLEQSDRRRIPRIDFERRVELEAPQWSGRVEANSVNLSEAGLCVRLQALLDIHAPVTLRLFAEPHGRPLQCGGRVAWVVQRLDLRDAPPFVYDVGLEFVNPPSRLRQFASRIGVTLKSSPRLLLGAKGGVKRLTGGLLPPAILHGRTYDALVLHERLPESRWHLIIKADGVPCLSHRYETEHAALEAWKQFKRQETLSMKHHASH